MRLLWLVVFLLVAPLSTAQEWRTDPLTPLDRQFMDKAKAELNDVAQLGLGRSFGAGRDSDLRLIQTLLDRRLVGEGDTRLLQAMGIVMGDYLQREHRLEWVIYVDKVGRSRALEVPNQEDFIFPVTQISHRVAVDADVDVEAIYKKLEEEVAFIKKKIIVR